MTQIKLPAFAVLIDNKLLSWGYGAYTQMAPNPHIDPEYFSSGTFDYLEKFVSGEEQVSPIRPRKAKISVKRFRVKNLSDLASRLKKYTLHPKFRGLDITSMKIITGERNVSK